MVVPSMLLVGNVTVDVAESGPLPGGSVYYGGAVGSALGMPVQLLTAFGDDFPADCLTEFPGWQVHRVPAADTTSMRNDYDEDGHRRQRLYAAGERLRDARLLVGLPPTDIALLCPVFGEIEPELARTVRARLTGASLQGWLRQAAPDGTICLRAETDFLHDLAGVDVLFFSEEDVAGQPGLRGAFLEAAPVVIETGGPDGARVFHDGKVDWIVGTPVDEVDPTGAGDTFAVAFLAHYARHGDVQVAVRFACRVAAHVVMASGPLTPDLLMRSPELAAFWNRPFA